MAMADGMDWQPTTPPIQHKPYGNRYIPGGWPEASPAQTTGAFARKRGSSDLITHAKRFCSGLSRGFWLALETPRLVVNYTVVPAYQIVRSVRIRQGRGSGTNAPVRTRNRVAQHPHSAKKETSQSQSTSCPTSTQSDQDRIHRTQPVTKSSKSEAKNPSLENINSARRGTNLKRKAQILLTPDPDETPAKYQKPSAQSNPSLNKPNLAPTTRQQATRLPTPEEKEEDRRMDSSGSTPLVSTPWKSFRPVSTPKVQQQSPPDSPSTQLMTELQARMRANDNQPDSDSEEVDPRWVSTVKAGKAYPVYGRLSAMRKTRLYKQHIRTAPDRSTPSAPVVVIDDDDEANGSSKAEQLFQAPLQPPPVKYRSVSTVSMTTPSADSANPRSPDGQDEEGVTADVTTLGESSEDVAAIADEKTHASIPALAPTTPLQVTMKEQQETTETPDLTFAKLSLRDQVDVDTPKANRHSAEKSSRLTRAELKRQQLKKEKILYEIAPLTGEWDQKVKEAVRKGHGKYLASDLARVVPQYAGRGQDNWLNDETINGYLNLVTAHGKKNDREGQIPSHHAFNSFFYTNLSTKGPDSVKRWGSRAKIGGKNLVEVDKVFIPINSGAHWTLGVVHPKERLITHYNSMRSGQLGTRACEHMKAWVRNELGTSFKEEEWTMQALGESPQQTNSDDCGVFTITSARQIMLGYTPMSYESDQIPVQRKRIVAELMNDGLLKSKEDD